MQKIKKKNERGFTLIELLITIALVVLITAVLYFSLNTSLESWGYARDRLSIQKVMQDVMDTIVSGPEGGYGLRDSLQVISASKTQLEFVPPWIDDTHSGGGADSVYTLNKVMRPGSAVPVAQIRLANSSEWKIAPDSVVESDNENESQVQLDLNVPEGTPLRFIYHPDPEAQPETVHRFYFDEDTRRIMLGTGEEEIDISKNLFGVEIVKMEMTYYTNTNQLVTDRDSVDEADIPVITAVEIFIEARLNQETQTLRNFISLRNAPMRTGYLTLKRGMKIRIPDSKKIRTLTMTNFTGIANNDRIQLRAEPASGKDWVLTVYFEKIGSAKPVISRYTIEYPAGTTVFTDYPKTDADLGLNLKLLGTDGMYDYDDDDNTDDAVLLQGDVELTVKEMNLKGAGLFVRP